MTGVKRLIFSLQGKFILVTSACILIFTISGSFFFISRESNLYRQDVLNQGKTLAEISRLMLTNVMVYKELGMMDEQDLIDYLDYYIINLMQQDKRVKLVSVLDNKREILACNETLKSSNLCIEPVTNNPTDKLETIIASGKYRNESVINILAPLNISTKSWGNLRIALSTKNVEEAIASLKAEMFFIASLFSVLSLVIVSIGAKVLSRPVTRLASIMDNIKSHGDIDKSLPTFSRRRDEIGDLQWSFLWMLKRLREADEEHKKTLEVLGQTEKMVSIGRLASGVAHEINNPLGGITLCFKNLIESDMEDSKRKKLVGAINDGLQKIKKIIEQLLDFSRMTVTEKSPVNVNNLINRLLVLVDYPASKKDIRIVNDLSDDIPEILIDENKITQVFLNIMLNALQAMGGEGILTIKTGKDNGFCKVSINDTGAGILPEIMPNIFDPFYTTKGIGEGTGLGLSVSKGIVEQHGGMIEVDSKVGIGTTFNIKLPLNQK